MHARWAMLGVAGMAAPEIVGNPFVDGPLPNWADAPFFDGYIADANTLFVVQMFMMNWAEVRRWQDMKNPGSVHADPYDESRKCTGTDVGYPGGRPCARRRLPTEGSQWLLQWAASFNTMPQAPGQSRISRHTSLILLMSQFSRTSSRSRSEGEHLYPDAISPACLTPHFKYLLHLEFAIWAYYYFIC